MIDGASGLPIFDGKYAFASGPAAGAGTLSQSVAVVPGGDCTLGFYLAHLDTAAGPSSFSVQVGDTTFSLAAHFLPFSYSKFTVNTVASSPRLGVTFSFYNVPSLWMLDAVALSSPTPVPEPGTWALMATGLLTLGFKATRRRRPD